VGLEQSALELSADDEVDDTTSSQWLSDHLRTARVIKAYNTIYAGRLHNDNRSEWPVEQRLAVPVAGDDTDAKHVVARLVERIGFAAADAGGLADTRRPQPGSVLYRAYAESRQAGTFLTPAVVRGLLDAADVEATA
jgi:hypothetical protein